MNCCRGIMGGAEWSNIVPVCQPRNVHPALSVCTCVWVCSAAGHNSKYLDYVCASLWNVNQCWPTAATGSGQSKCPLSGMADSREAGCHRAGSVRGRARAEHMEQPTSPPGSTDPHITPPFRKSHILWDQIGPARQ